MWQAPVCSLFDLASAERNWGSVKTYRTYSSIFVGWTSIDVHQGTRVLARPQWQFYFRLRKAQPSCRAGRESGSECLLCYSPSQAWFIYLKEFGKANGKLGWLFINIYIYNFTYVYIQLPIYIYICIYIDTRNFAYTYIHPSIVVRTYVCPSVHA